MTGRNHLIVSSSVFAGGLAVSCAAASSHISDFRSVPLSMIEYLYPSVICGDISQGLLTWWPFYLLCSVVLLLFGSLLPDIDSKKSLLGRFLYIPIEHRTWTHSVWFVLLFALLGLIHPLLRFVWIGGFLHILADEFSKGGICFMYPFHTYKKYGNGAFIARGHKISFYHTGTKSEIVCVVIVAVVSAIICGFCWRGWVGFWRWITL